MKPTTWRRIAENFFVHGYGIDRYTCLYRPNNNSQSCEIDRKICLWIRNLITLRTFFFVSRKISDIVKTCRELLCCHTWKFFQFESLFSSTFTRGIKAKTLAFVFKQCQNIDFLFLIFTEIYSQKCEFKKKLSSFYLKLKILSL